MNNDVESNDKLVNLSNEGTIIGPTLKCTEVTEFLVTTGFIIEGSVSVSLSLVS